MNAALVHFKRGSRRPLSESPIYRFLSPHWGTRHTASRWQQFDLHGVGYQAALCQVINIVRTAALKETRRPYFARKPQTNLAAPARRKPDRPGRVYAPTCVRPLVCSPWRARD